VILTDTVMLGEMAFRSISSFYLGNRT